MPKKSRQIKQEKPGQPTKYTKAMPAELIKLFTEGLGREDFCAANDISEKTFDNWLDAHPEFAEAYLVAQAKAKVWFMSKARDHMIQKHEGDKLDTKLWSMMMRNRFELTEHRKLKIEGLKAAKNFAEQMQQILNELAAGNLTGSEAQQLAKLVETGVRVHETTLLEQRVNEIEKAGRLGVSDSEFKEEPDWVPEVG